MTDTTKLLLANENPHKNIFGGKYSPKFDPQCRVCKSNKLNKRVKLTMTENKIKHQVRDILEAYLTRKY